MEFPARHRVVIYNAGNEMRVRLSSENGARNATRRSESDEREREKEKERGEGDVGGKEGGKTHFVITPKCNAFAPLSRPA